MYISVVGFESNVIIWINLGGLRMLYMSLALNWILCEFTQMGGLWKNFICDHNELFEYQ